MRQTVFALSARLALPAQGDEATAKAPAIGL
jgi:hypothetical protein